MFSSYRKMRNFDEVKSLVDFFESDKKYNLYISYDDMRKDFDKSKIIKKIENTSYMTVDYRVFFGTGAETESINFEYNPVGNVDYYISKDNTNIVVRMPVGYKGHEKYYRVEKV